MDECDTAARVMDCGKNADALVMENMVAAVDLIRVVRTTSKFALLFSHTSQ
jgi:hypothetical protein